MLAEPKLRSLNELVKGASRDELIWISGYIAALTGQPVIAGDLVKEFVEAPPVSMQACTVVYGTETGNSKKVAVDFSTRLKKQGIQAKIKSLDQYRVTDLAKESNLVVVISTQGDGEPPAAAKKFYDYILQNELSLSNLKYGVLALGDTSYPLFCKAGEDVDTRLHELGAQRLISLKKCDTDFEDDANSWINDLINTALASGNGSDATVIVKPKPAKTGKKFYDATVATRINLNDQGSNKETYHVEIVTEEPFYYEPGDSIGIIPKNNSATVKKVLSLLQLDGTEEFQYKDELYKAADLFTGKLNVLYLPERIVQQYAKLVNKDIPSIKMDLADLLRIYPADKNLDMQQLLAILDPIVPRLYSISSAPLAHGENEVHIIVSRSSFNVDGHQRYGLCSDYISCLCENSQIQIYLQKNCAFRLPNPGEDAIMIGPGTGIAPFRSFLFERDARSDEGRNWLFFGEQHFVTDFLYQTDLLGLFDTGVLTRLNTAFSRDQKEKLYVQHRMQQQSKELFKWIDNGAHIYICGAREPMSVDVEQTLLDIIAQEKNLDEEGVAEYLSELKETGRYHKDVY